jgi:hypothetical protein
MYATRYFPDRYFAPRYFPKVGADATPPDPSAFNNSTQNWLSPTMHLGLLLGLWWSLRGVP